MKLSRQAGIPVRIRACDTMGYGVPYSEVALPRSVPGIVYGLQHYSDVHSEYARMARPQRLLQSRDQRLHRVAVRRQRASTARCSGIGERTGNIPLEAMVMEYASLRGSLDGMDPTVITEIADYFKHEHRLQNPADDAVCRPRLQHDPRRHPCRRPAEGRRNLQYFRHQKAAEPPRRRS